MPKKDPREGGWSLPITWILLVLILIAVFVAIKLLR